MTFSSKSCFSATFDKGMRSSKKRARSTLFLLCQSLSSRALQLREREGEWTINERSCIYDQIDKISRSVEEGSEKENLQADFYVNITTQSYTVFWKWFCLFIHPNWPTDFYRMMSSHGQTTTTQIKVMTNFSADLTTDKPLFGFYFRIR